MISTTDIAEASLLYLFQIHWLALSYFHILNRSLMDGHFLNTAIKYNIKYDIAY